MTIEYAKAYSKERITHAQRQRLQREAVLGYKTTRDPSVRPIRTAVGNRLINIGERLAAT